MRFAGTRIDLALVDDPVVTKAAAVLKNVEAAPKIQPVGQRNGGLRARTQRRKPHPQANVTGVSLGRMRGSRGVGGIVRSEEHTSELQSRFELVCRLLLEKKNNKKPTTYSLLT